MNLSVFGIIAVGMICLLVPIAIIGLVLYLTRRTDQPAPPSQSYDPFGQQWQEQQDAAAEHDASIPSVPGREPAASPREWGDTGSVRRVADQSSEVGVPTPDEPDVRRYDYLERESVSSEPEPEPEPESETAGSTEPDIYLEPTATSDRFAVHEASDEVEQTIRISRSSGEEQPTPPSWAAAIPDEEPEPVVEETVRRGDLTFDEAVSDEHTYWDDEEAEQARQAESLVGTEEVVDGGYGWGSAAPFADGSMPPGHPVKGHREWMHYHEPGSPWYDETTVDVWFTDAAAAERAGFHRA